MFATSVLRALPFTHLLACGGLLAESNADDAGPADAGFDDDAPYEPLPDSAMPPPALPGFVSAQGDSTCTLLNDGTVKCRGEFEGELNTAQADQDAAAPGERYVWGVENGNGGGADAGVTWTGQSMVFPITFHP